MAENRKAAGRHGLYYFNRGQLIILAAGFAVTSVVVFLLGVLIGQGIEERKLLKSQEEPLVKIPVQPLAKGSGSGSGSPAKEEMTFYDTLAKAPSGASPSRVELAKKIKPVEKAEKAAAKEAKVPAQEEAMVAAQKIKEKESAEKTASVAEAKKEAPAKKAPEVEAGKAGSAAGERPWTVQVNAYAQERDANNLVKRLTDKGYDAYVVPTNIKGKTWYRVRVGHFAKREEARELQDALKNKEKFTKAMAVSR